MIVAADRTRLLKILAVIVAAAEAVDPNSRKARLGPVTLESSRALVPGESAAPDFVEAEH